MTRRSGSTAADPAAGRKAAADRRVGAPIQRERCCRRIPIFWVGLAVVVLARTLIAMSRTDEFRGEELYIGSFAWALIRGMPLDPEQLPIIVHLRGSVVFGVLCAPLFWVLGPSLLGLKVLAVSWSGASGGLFAFVLERRAGRIAALAGALAYALLPPSFQMLDVLALGSHGDTLLPILGALALLFARDEPLGWKRALALGACCGFGCFFSLQFVVALPALALAWWAHDRRFLLRRASLAFPAAAAFLAAPIPLISTAATLVTKPISAHLLPDGAGGASSKLIALLGGDLRRSWLFDDNGGAWLGWLYLAALVAGLALLVPRLRRPEPLALFCLVYPALVLGAFVASDFELNLLVKKPGMGSRYFMPLLPFLAAWPALGVPFLLQRAGKLPATALLGATLLAGAGGFVALCDLGTPWRRPPVRGTNLAFFALHVDHAGGDSLRARLDWARTVEPDWDPYRALAYTNIHTNGALAGDALGLAELQRVADLEQELRPFELVHFGHELGHTTRRDDVARELGRLPDEPEVAWFLRGVGRGTMALGLAQLIQSGGRQLDAYRVLNRIPAPSRATVAEGAGFHLGFVFTPYHDHLLRAVSSAATLPADMHAPFFRGLGLGYRLRFREQSYAPPEPGATTIERAVAAPDRAAFRAGLTAPTTGF